MTLSKVSLLLATCLIVPSSVTIGASSASASRRSADRPLAAARTCSKPPGAPGRAARGSPGTSPAGRGARTAALPPQSAGTFARDVLAEAVIPPGAVLTKIQRGSALAAPLASPAVKQQTDLDDAYKVGRSVSSVLAFEITHLPRGAHLLGTGSNCSGGTVSPFVLESVPVSGGHEFNAMLAVGITPTGKNSSLLRVDAQTVWVASRSAAEKAQRNSVLKLTILGSSPARGNVTVLLRGAQEQAVTSRLNSLPLAAATQCAERDPLYQLRYTNPSASFLATGYGCSDTVLVQADGRASAPLHDRGLSLIGLMNGFLPSTERIPRNNSAGGWAGWVNVSPPTGKSYQSSFAEWTVPSVSCDPFEMAGASEWTGVDGFNESTVEQLGTQSDCVVGTGTFAAWFELFGTPISGGFQVDLPDADHVHPGDLISAQVVAGQGSGGSGFPGLGMYLFNMVNFTEHWSWSTLTAAVSPAPPDQTAEWIVEQPSCFWVCQALAVYGKVRFTDMDMSLSTFAYPFGPIFPPSTFPGFSVNLVTDGTLKETGSPLVKGNEEDVSWVHR
jgi:Peptidase A4 family